MSKLIDDAIKVGANIIDLQSPTKIYSKITKSIIFDSKQLAKFAALQQPHWISVTEKLPEDNIYVIALESDGELYKLHKSTNQDGTFWKDKENYFYHEVTHWMPLLAQPSVNEKDE